MTDLQKSMLAFEDFLNEPPAYEELLRVREYRHEAYREWLKLRGQITATLSLQDHGWRTMETAPKDGAPFIYQDSDEAVSTCSWQSDDCGHSWWDIAGDQIAYPVRWMPLPPVRVMVAEDGAKS